MVSHQSGTLPGGFFATGTRFTVDAYVWVRASWRVQLHEELHEGCMGGVADNLAGPFVAAWGSELLTARWRATATVVSIGDGDTSG